MRTFVVENINQKENEHTDHKWKSAEEGAAAAQDQTTDSLSTQESKQNLMQKLHEVQQYLDEKAKAAVVTLSE